jgi:ribonuclease III
VKQTEGKTGDNEFADFEEKLSYRFRDHDLLRVALTHPSVAYEGSGSRTNQRLEFLGDAVLQLVLTRELYSRFEAQDEGPLTKARAKLVNRRTLAEQARNLDLGSHIILSKGEEQQGGRDRQSSLADTFEAVLGGVFLDGGFEAAQKVILRLFADAFTGLEVLPVIENPKGELQELLQSTTMEAPRYSVESVTGPDHDRVFVCTVHHCGAELGSGRGKSKKLAESEAASAALAKLRAARAESRKT